MSSGQSDREQFQAAWRELWLTLLAYFFHGGWRVFAVALILAEAVALVLLIGWGIGS